jgi:TPR repeat protein
VASRQLDSEELSKLLKRSETFLNNGDIAAARLLLRRAAEGGEARAALALAATYDPLVLKQLGAIGAKDDITQARGWYQRALQLGSTEAGTRLQQLAQETR